MENGIFIGVLLVIFYGTIAFLTRDKKPQEKKGE
jgi:hypothetical protein